MPEDRGTVRVRTSGRPGRRLLRAQRVPKRHASPRKRPLVHGGIGAALFAITALVAFFPATLPAPPADPMLRVGALSFPGLPASAPAATVSSLESAPVPLTVIAPPVTPDTVLLAADGTTSALRQIEAEQENSAEPADGIVRASRASNQLPLFFRHRVEDGETLSAIAAHYGVSEQHIVWNNVDLIVDQDALRAGDLLQVPSVEGIIHSVRVGETLTDIADQYDADVQDIIRFPANGLADPNLLTEGSMILVPGGRVVAPPAQALRPEEPPPAAAEDLVTDDGAADGGVTVQPPAPEAPAAPAVPVQPSNTGTGFLWPVVDFITSPFGPSHPLGIDINAPYVPVIAASAGQVVFAGGDPCCSYGLYVDIAHGDGYETRYAHFSSLSVGLGQWVEQGQVLGVSGATGRSTGPHLHFELRRNGVIQNPMLFLP